MKAFINGVFENAENVTISINDLAIQRGYGVFDFFGVQNGKPLFIDAHLERLFKSAKSLRLEIKYSKQELKEIVFKLIEENDLQNQSGIKIIITGGNSIDSYQPTIPNIIITQQIINLPTIQDFNKGIKLITHEYVRELPQVKSINYLTGIYLQNKISDSMTNDVLYVKEGNVFELPRANIFIVTKNDELITPIENVLLGVTRNNILNLSTTGIHKSEKPVKVEDLLNAKAVFITSTTKRILPVIEINGTSINNGKVAEITTTLYQQLLDFEQEYLNAN